MCFDEDWRILPPIRFVSRAAVTAFATAKPLFLEIKYNLHGDEEIDEFASA